MRQAAAAVWAARMAGITLFGFTAQAISHASLPGYVHSFSPWHLHA
jgi:hypothetical protein